jgi:hypothetical protein
MAQTAKAISFQQGGTWLESKSAERQTVKSFKLQNA